MVRVLPCCLNRFSFPNLTSSALGPATCDLRFATYDLRLRICLARSDIPSSDTSRRSGLVAVASRHRVIRRRLPLAPQPSSTIPQRFQTQSPLAPLLAILSPLSPPPKVQRPPLGDPGAPVDVVRSLRFDPPVPHRNLRPLDPRPGRVSAEDPVVAHSASRQTPLGDQCGSPVRFLIDSALCCLSNPRPAPSPTPCRASFLSSFRGSSVNPAPRQTEPAAHWCHLLLRGL